MINKNYCFSVDQERFQGEGCDSLEEVIAEAINFGDLKEGDSVEIGEYQELTMRKILPDFDQLIEMAIDRGADYVGEAMDLGFHGLNEKDRPKETTMEQIENEIAAVFEGYGIKPRCYEVINQFTYIITKKDMENK